MRKIFVIIFSVIVSCNIFAQNPIWSRGTAFTVSYKKFEINLLSPSKYGITKKSEISAHPVAFFAMPHIFYKHKWTNILLFNKTLFLSSRHGLYYPTAALNNTIRFGLDFLPPPKFNAPASLALQNEAIVSMFLQEPSQCEPGDKLITAKLGFKYAFKFGNEPFPTISRAVLYRETLAGTPAFIWYTTLGINARFNSYFNYFAEAQFYSHAFFKDISAEAKAGLMGYSGKKMSSFGGIKIAYSQIPSGNKFLLIPIFDISYTFSLKKDKSKEMSLFGTEVFKHDNSLDLEGDENIYYRYEDRSKKTDDSYKKESFLKRLFSRQS